MNELKFIAGIGITIIGIMTSVAVGLKIMRWILGLPL